MSQSSTFEGFMPSKLYVGKSRLRQQPPLRGLPELRFGGEQPVRRTLSPDIITGTGASPVGPFARLIEKARLNEQAADAQKLVESGVVAEAIGNTVIGFDGERITIPDDVRGAEDPPITEGTRMFPEYDPNPSHDDSGSGAAIDRDAERFAGARG